MRRGPGASSSPAPAAAGIVVLVLAGLVVSPPPAAADRPHVRVVATGGTIASRAPSPEQLSGYSVALTGEELVQAVPALADVAEVTVEQFSNVGSTGISPEMWVRLSQRVGVLLSEGVDGRPVDGVVVTHGTDALEETAYFLTLTVRSPKPVVVVGAMRPASAISADGPLNLLNAVRVAAHPEARERGTLVVLNQEIHAAREVTKGHTLKVETFASRGRGTVGTVDPDDVVFYRRAERRHSTASEFDLGGFDPAELPRVDVVYAYNGADGTAVEAFVAAGAGGIVLAGSGAGAAPPGVWEALREAAGSGVVVVRSSRTGAGRVPGGWDPERSDGLPVLSADDLSPQKARILLMLGLTRTSDPAELERLFSEY